MAGHMQRERRFFIFFYVLQYKGKRIIRQCSCKTLRYISKSRVHPPLATHKHMNAATSLLQECIYEAIHIFLCIYLSCVYKLYTTCIYTSTIYTGIKEHAYGVSLKMTMREKVHLPLFVCVCA